MAIQLKLFIVFVALGVQIHFAAFDQFVEQRVGQVKLAYDRLKFLVADELWRWFSTVRRMSSRQAASWMRRCSTGTDSSSATSSTARQKAYRADMASRLGWATGRRRAPGWKRFCG